MGNEEEPISETLSRESYLFVQSVEDRNFGAIKIYRKQIKPYGFVMHWRLFFLGSTREQVYQLVHELRSIREAAPPFTARVLWINQPFYRSSEFLCAEPGHVEAIQDYFNYNLKQLQHDWLSIGRTFSQEELWHVLFSLATVRGKLQELSVRSFPCSLEEVFVSPSWQIVVYPNMPYFKGQGCLFKERDQCQIRPAGNNRVCMERESVRVDRLPLGIVELMTGKERIRGLEEANKELAWVQGVYSNRLIALVQQLLKNPRCDVLEYMRIYSSQIAQVDSLSPDQSRDRRKPVKQLDFKSRMMNPSRTTYKESTSQSSSSSFRTIGAGQEGPAWNLDRIRFYQGASSVREFQ